MHRALAARVSTTLALSLFMPSQIMAQDLRWQFATDAEREIGSADLMRPDGRPLVALRCLAPGISVPDRIAYPSAVGRVAARGLVAVLVAPDVLADPGAPGAASLRAQTGAAETLSVRLEVPDNVPMAPLSAGSPLFAALTNGDPVTLEIAGAAPIGLDAAGLPEALRQLVGHCGLPAQPTTPPPGLAFPRLFDGTNMAIVQNDIVSRAVQAAPAQPMQSAAGHAAPSPAMSIDPSATWSGEDEFNTAVLLWVLGQRPELVTEGPSSLDEALSETALPPQFPAYPAPIDTNERRADNAANRDARAAWLAAVIATAAAVSPSPPDRYVLETPVQARFEEGLWRLVPFSRVHQTEADARDDGLTIRKIYHEIPSVYRAVVEMNESDPMPLALPDALVAGWPTDQQGPTFFLRAAIALSDHALAPRYGGTARNGSTMIGATMRIEQAVLHEAVGSKRDTAGPAVHAWDRASAAPAAASPTLASSPDPAAVGDVFGTGLLDGRMLTSLRDGMWDYRPDLVRDQPSHFARAGEVADREAEFATRLAAVVRASPERPLSIPVAEQVARSLLTPAERDRLFPVRMFDESFERLEFEAALRAREADLKAAVLRLGIDGEVPATQLGLAGAGVWQAALGGIAVRGRSDGLLWFAAADPQVTYPDFLQANEARALEILRTQQDSGLASSFVARVDYTFGPANVPPGGSGPIEDGDVERVRISATPTRLVLYADFAMTAPLYEASFGQPPSQIGAPLPDDVALTTVDSLFATFDRLQPEGSRGKERLEQEVEGRRQFRGVPDSQREATVAAEIARVRALARDDLWLSWVVRVDPYDPERGGFPVASAQSLAPPVPVDSFADVIGVRFAQPEEAELIPVPQDRRAEVEALIERDRLYTMLRVTLDSVTGEYDGELNVRPVEIIVGPPNRDHVVASVALRLPWSEAEQATVTTSAEFEVPERLILDPEAIDLIVLARAPDLYGDAAIERMLVERLARERAAFGEDDADLPWGRFFDDPTVGLSSEGRRALVPAFRDWSLARAARLPERLMIAQRVDRRAGSGRFAPDCEGPRPLTAPAGHPAETVVDEVLGAGTMERFGKAALLRASDRYSAEAKDSRTWAFALHGRPFVAERGGFQLCPAAEQVARRARGAAAFDEGFEARTAGHADLIVIAEGFTAVPTAAQAIYTGYEITAATIGVVPLAGPDDVAPGLVAAVVIGGEVERIFALRAGPLDQPPSEDEIWSAAAEAAARAQPMAAEDILGLTLGMDRAAFEAEAAAALSSPVKVLRRNGERGTFGDAVGYFDPDARELLLGVTPRGLPDGPIIAILRVLEFAPGVATQEALVAQLTEKYGPPMPHEAGSLQVSWGLPDRSIDRVGTCGGDMRGTRMPGQFELPGEPSETAASTLGSLRLPDALGWQEESALDRAGSVGAAPLDECGPALIAIFYDGADGLSVRLWLVDMQAAVATRELPRDVPEAPKIRL